MMSSQNSAKVSKKDGTDKPFQEIFNMHVAKCTHKYCIKEIMCKCAKTLLKGLCTNT